MSASFTVPEVSDMSARTQEAWQYVKKHGICSVVMAMFLGKDHYQGMGTWTAYKIAQLPREQQEEIMDEGARMAKRGIRTGKRFPKKEEHRDAKSTEVRVTELKNLLDMMMHIARTRMEYEPERASQMLSSIWEFIDEKVLKKVANERKPLAA